jgi:glycosyltransferase involved in cell wall biosynthesis
MPPLKILHVLRAPVGGLFRHVTDLAREQIARGHHVGMIVDSRTGNARADALLGEMEPSLALGLSRVAMRRQPGPEDVLSLSHVMRRMAATEADVVHGHGAKGGAFARLAFNRREAARAYTPHGGSLLFSHDTLGGKIYLTTEKLLMPRGDLYLFESAFSADTFRRKIGAPRTIARVVHNGVTPAEFAPLTFAADATDLLFMGEMRQLKGVDVLLEAIALLRRNGRAVSATLVGDGQERDTFKAQASSLGLGSLVRFRPAMPARQAQTLGHVMVVPSRMESLPYVVLETAAAGKPLIATRVGGIAEIFGPLAPELVPADDAPALAAAILGILDAPDTAAEKARTLRERVAALFSLKAMTDGVLAAYGEALEFLAKSGRR